MSPQLADTLHTMRNRLVHTLSLWLLGAVCASVLALGSFTAWNLREGFGAYLQARDVERLDLLVQVLVQDIERAGGAQAWATQPLDMPSLLRAHALLDGVAPRNDGPPGPGSGPFRPGPPPRDGGFAPPAHRPPPGQGERFGARVAVFISEGQRWVGPTQVREASHLIERPVEWQGKVVAVVKLRPLERLPEANEARFLRAQYEGIAAVTVGLMALALACAWWLARQWARPLVAVQHATERIANGELGVRLPTSRSDEIGDVMRNVNHMAESLQRMESTRRRWMADMSHELRTPLAVLRGEIEALVDGVRPLTSQAMLSLREDALRLGSLVDDLHLLAMADLQALPCRPTELDATEVVQSALDRCQFRAAQAGLILSWAGLPPPELRVCWDPQRMDQLLTNLFENSLRYTDAPGAVRVSLAIAEGAGAAPGPRVHLSVADSAPGVPAADLHRLFEPLYRADQARSRHTGGSGLGLAIVAAIAAAHQGSVRAQPSPLGGLCVVVDLPLDASPPGRTASPGTTHCA